MGCETTQKCGIKASLLGKCFQLFLCQPSNLAVLHPICGAAQVQHGGAVGGDDGGHPTAHQIVQNPLLCLLIQLLAEKKIVFLQKNAVPYTIGYAAFCGIGNLLLLIALKYLPASVQYPIVTGGTMVFSTLISGIRKEKLSLRNLIATGVALVSTVVIAL